MAILLIILSALVFIGLLSEWTYQAWRIVDIIIIFCCATLAIILLSGEKISSFIKSGKYKKFRKGFFVLAITIFLLCVVYGFIWYVQYKNQTVCNFSFKGLHKKIYHEDGGDQGEYDECLKNQKQINDQKSGWNLFSFSICHRYEPYSATYWEIEGLLSNDSKTSQKLDSVIAKIYTSEDKILLTEGAKGLNMALEGGQSVPFNFKVEFDRLNLPLKNFYNPDDEVVMDIYPYFDTCNY